MREPRLESITGSRTLSGCGLWITILPSPNHLDARFGTNLDGPKISIVVKNAGQKESRRVMDVILTYWTADPPPVCRATNPTSPSAIALTNVVQSIVLDLEIDISFWKLAD